MKCKLVVLIPLILIIAFTMSCSSDPTAPKYIPQIITVSMVDNEFQPPRITVNKNDTIKWVNNGFLDHTTTSGEVGVPNGIWDSGIIHLGSSYSFTFNDTGTYQYFCSIYWQQGMVGSVTVVEP